LPIATAALQRLATQSSGKYSLLFGPDEPGEVRDDASMGCATLKSTSNSASTSTSTFTNKNKKHGQGGDRRRVLMVPVAHETGSSTPNALASDAAVRGNLLFQAQQVRGERE